jgi:hypothetical protein
MITWIVAAILAGATGGQINQIGAQKDLIVVSVPGATMTCTKEGDHLVCVLPLDKDCAAEPRQQPAAAPTMRPYKPAPPMVALPDPEATTQLNVAKANIALAQSLLPKATEPEERVFAQQLLYWANEQYRTAQALLHTVRGDLRDAVDPFESRDHKSEPME